MLLTLKLDRLKPKHIVILYSLALFAAVWIFVLLAYLPQTVHTSELRAQLENQRQQVKIVEGFGLAYPEADKYLSELDKRLTILDQMLPNNPDVSEFMLQMERAARETGIRISQLKPAAPLNKEGYREIPLEILIKGTFFQTAAFVKKMEDGRRFSLVQSLSMQSRQGIIDSRLNVVIYSFGASQPAADSLQPNAGKNK